MLNIPVTQLHDELNLFWKVTLKMNSRCQCYNFCVITHQWLLKLSGIPNLVDSDWLSITFHN
jgi:hypothetical protein